MKLNSRPVFLACCLLGAAGASAAAPYDFSLLPTLGGSTGSASAINNAGVVVGASALAGNTASHATYWLGGTASDLGTLGSLNAVSGASGINASGQISGYSQIGAGGTNSVTHAVLWPGPNAYPKADLGAVDGLSAASSSAFAINDKGAVVGYGGSADYFREAHYWKTSADLKNIAAGFAAYGINNNNQIVGDTGFINGASQVQSLPALWTLNANGTFAETVLGLLPGAPRAYASDISDSGMITGTQFFTSGAYHAARWNANTTVAIDLGTLGGSSSTAGGLNEAGLVVGASTTAAGFTHAALWGLTGAAVDLNSLIDPVAADGWVLTAANDINDSGMIVGTASRNGETRAFLLSVSAVPEPASVALMLAGLALVAGVAHKRGAGSAVPRS